MNEVVLFYVIEMHCKASFSNVSSDFMWFDKTFYKTSIFTDNLKIVIKYTLHMNLNWIKSFVYLFCHFQFSRFVNNCYNNKLNLCRIFSVMIVDFVFILYLYFYYIIHNPHNNKSYCHAVLGNNFVRGKVISACCCNRESSYWVSREQTSFGRD